MKNNWINGILFFSVCLLFPALPVSGNSPDITLQIENWYTQHKEAAGYLGIKNEVISICLRAADSSVPYELLFTRFQEGVVKQIPRQRILATLAEDERQLLFIVRMLDMTGILYKQEYGGEYFQLGGISGGAVRIRDLLPGDKEGETLLYTRTELIKHLSLCLRSGLTNGIMAQLFSEAAGRGWLYLYPLYLCKAVSEIPAVTKLAESELLAMCQAILASSLTLSGYTVIPSLFLKGSRYNMSYPVIARIITEQLAWDGGLIQIEQELNRRGRKR